MATTTIWTYITIDLSCKSPRAKIYAKQGDSNNRQVGAHFKKSLSDSDYIDVSTGSYDHVEFNVLRPDGYVVKSTASISSGGGGEYAYGTLTAEMLEKAGRAFGDFVLVDASGNRLSGDRFVIEIGEAADSEKAIPPPTPTYLLMIFDAIRPASVLAGIISEAIRPASVLAGITATAEEAEEE